MLSTILGLYFLKAIHSHEIITSLLILIELTFPEGLQKEVYTILVHMTFTSASLVHLAMFGQNVLFKMGHRFFN